jgi:hypothetical protein
MKPVYQVIVLSCLLALGCGAKSDGPPIVSATGIVTLDSKPVEGASVTFTPKKKGMMSMAKTDANGRFVLMTSTGKAGAAVGDHDVFVSLTIDLGGNSPPVVSLDGLATATDAESGLTAPESSVAVPESAKFVVPEKYGKLGALSATVPPGGLKDHKIELSSN